MPRSRILLLLTIASLAAGCIINGDEDGAVFAEEFRIEAIHEQPDCYRWVVTHVEERPRAGGESETVHVPGYVTEPAPLKVLRDAHAKNQTVRVIAEKHEGPCGGWYIHYARPA